jgi:hypothetical protein
MGLYVIPNFKTKKAFKEAVAAGQDLSYFQYGPFGGNEPTNGTAYFEGPHYPQPHTWYATVQLKDGKIVSVK